MVPPAVQLDAEPVTRPGEVDLGDPSSFLTNPVVKNRPKLQRAGQLESEGLESAVCYLGRFSVLLKQRSQPGRAPASSAVLRPELMDGLEAEQPLPDPQIDCGAKPAIIEH